MHLCTDSVEFLRYCISLFLTISRNARILHIWFGNTPSSKTRDIGQDKPLTTRIVWTQLWRWRHACRPYSGALIPGKFEHAKRSSSNTCDWKNTRTARIMAIVCFLKSSDKLKIGTNLIFSNTVQTFILPNPLMPFLRNCFQAASGTRLWHSENKMRVGCVVGEI